MDLPAASQPGSLTRAQKNGRGATRPLNHSDKTQRNGTPALSRERHDMFTDQSENGPTAPDRTPPHNIHDEKVVLGAMMQSVNTLMDIMDVVRADEMYRPIHTTIYNAITELHVSGEPIDPVAVAAKLLEQGELQRIGGVPYLHECVESTPTAANGTFYARHVAEHALRRRLIEAGATVSRDAHNPTIPVDAAAQTAQDAVYNAVTSKNVAALPTAADAVTEALDLIEAAGNSDGQLKGISTGFSDLDRLTSGFQPGQLIIVAGRPGIGKSVATTDIARQNAIHDGKTVLMFNMEMTRAEIMTRIISAESRIPLHKLKAGQVEERDHPALVKASGDIGRSDLIIDDSAGMTLVDIANRAKRIRLQRGRLDLIVVDYLQLMGSANTRKNDTREREVAEMSRGLKVLAKTIGCPVIAASQLNRGPEQRTDKKPLLSDLRESGSIEQDADIVILLHREDYYDKESERLGEADFIVAKHRNGATDTITVAAQLHYSRFKDMAIV
jgi:replicative DNA helicase